jgi:hypothetical protein
VSIFNQDSRIVQIIGLASNNSGITMKIPLSDLTLGIHTYSGDSSEGFLNYISPSTQSGFSSQEVNGNFTINITSLDLIEGKMAGTFSAKLVAFSSAEIINLTEGSFNNMSIITNSFYSNGFMSLKRDGGSLITMDNNSNDGNFNTISQNSAANFIVLTGYSSTTTTPLELYSLKMPLNAAAGSYNLLNNTNYSAALGNSSNQAEFNLTSGSMTITSHDGNNIKGTFSYTVNNGTTTATITNGSFDITHK